MANKPHKPEEIISKLRQLLKKEAVRNKQSGASGAGSIQFLCWCFMTCIREIACHETMDEVGAVFGVCWRRYRWRTSSAKLH